MASGDNGDSQKTADVILRPNQSLLDADFETYKLDSRSLPVIRLDIATGKWRFQLSLDTEMMQLWKIAFM